VRVTFNPDNNDLVHQIKSKTAELINLLDQQNLNTREVAIAVQHYENAGMWAVKAVTAPKN
jgi:sulfur carrier protein ThiS